MRTGTGGAVAGVVLVAVAELAVLAAVAAEAALFMRCRCAM